VSNSHFRSRPNRSGIPRLRQAAGTLEAMRASVVRFGSEKRQRNKDK